MWLLDVDGTTSPFGITGPWHGPTLYSGSGDLAVPYRAELVERISRLAAEGVVEVRWLTTWDEELLKSWSEIGLGPFPSGAPPPSGRRRGGGRAWKADTVADILAENPGRGVIWTDDTANTQRFRDVASDRLLIIRPDAATGLTDGHLDEIERWARSLREPPAGSGPGHPRAGKTDTGPPKPCSCRLSR